MLRPVLATGTCRHTASTLKRLHAPLRCHPELAAHQTCQLHVACDLPKVHCPTCREFKLQDDMYAQDSIELLKQSGIDFAQNEARGIDVHKFGELLMSSGIVLNEDVSSA